MRWFRSYSNVFIGSTGRIQTTVQHGRCQPNKLQMKHMNKKGTIDEWKRSVKGEGREARSEERRVKRSE